MDKQNNKLNSRDFSINDVLILLLRYKKLIILNIILFFSIAFYFTITVPPVYKAHTTLMIKESKGVSDAFNFLGNNNLIEMENEKILITSRIVAENTVRELWEGPRRNNLNLFGTKVYIPRAQNERNFIKNIFNTFTFDYFKQIHQKRKILDSGYNIDTLRLYATKIQKNLEANNQRNTDIITLTYSSPFPDESALIVNTVANSYKKIDILWDANQAEQILRFVEEQASKIENALTIAEEKLKEYKQEEGIFDISGNSELLLNQLIDAESVYYNTIAELNITKERKKYISSTLSEEEKLLAGKLSNSMNNQLLTLRTEISKQEAELVMNETLLGKNHNAVVELSKEIKALKILLDQKTNEMIGQGITIADPLEYRQELIGELLLVESKMAGQEAQSNEYKNLVDKYNFQLNKLPSIQLSYARLERDRAVLNETYLFMRQKLEDSRIQVATESGKVQIIDKAQIPLFKDSPNHIFNLIFGILLGLLAGVSLSFLFEYFDNTIKSIDEINHLTVLGIIPKIKAENGRRTNKKQSFFGYLLNRYSHYKKVFLKTKIKPESKRNLQRHLITYEDPKSPISEAYRSLRTSLSFKKKDMKGKESTSILITSTGPGEGKTTTIANLAITYANLGKKTLLIDTDLRRPVVHKVFEKNHNRDGLSSFFRNTDKEIDEFIVKSEISNLSLLFSGIIPPNPSELLASEKMKGLILNLKKKYDIILFDTPPSAAVTDASLLAKIIDKVVFVVMPGKTDKRGFNHSLNHLNNIGINIDGVVFNGIDSKNSYGSYYYYYQYYNYYGKDK